MSTATEEPTTDQEYPPQAVAPEQLATTAAKPGNLWKREEVIELPDGRRALLRLPNQFQHADIRQASLAAKARRMRQLRDPEADAYVVLESDMDELTRLGDKEVLVDEIVGREWWRDHLSAMNIVKEQREEFEYIDRDKERWEELHALPMASRDPDEWGELDRHIAAYNTQVEKESAELTRPRREGVAALEMDALVDLAREDRIKQEGNLSFQLHFSLWQVYSGTYVLAETQTKTIRGQEVQVPVPGPRLFPTIEAAREADPNLLDAITDAFAKLEASFATGLQGNS